MTSLFITGASGFIGRSLLQSVDPSKYSQIYCLVRNPGALSPSVLGDGNYVVIRGSIFDTEAYRSRLSKTETVVHLAAATGKVLPQEYFNVNTEGTRVLVRECKQAGVRNFLQISSIAVNYADKSGYYYAQSKEIAEEIVQASGLNYTIVRPTIVIGKGAPIWGALSKLGRAPIIPILGDGKTTMQPIYIDDLIACLLMIVYEKNFSNETFDLGGPEKITVEDFLRRIHYHYHGNEGRAIHIPTRPLIMFLSLLERLFYSALPMTVGQLSAFRNDGTTAPNNAFIQQSEKMKNLDQMLKVVIGNGK